MQVIDLETYKQYQELLVILEDTSVSPLQATILHRELLEGKTLATALRSIGLRSAYELPQPVLNRLHAFRNTYFPAVAVDPISR